MILSIALVLFGILDLIQGEPGRAIFDLLLATWIVGTSKARA